jgi:hypothetical protein
LVHGLFLKDGPFVQVFAMTFAQEIQVFGVASSEDDVPLQLISPRRVDDDFEGGKAKNKLFSNSLNRPPLSSFFFT